MHSNTTTDFWDVWGDSDHQKHTDIMLILQYIYYNNCDLFQIMLTQQNAKTYINAATTKTKLPILKPLNDLWLNLTQYQALWKKLKNTKYPLQYYTDIDMWKQTFFHFQRRRCFWYTIQKCEMIQYTPLEAATPRLLVEYHWKILWGKVKKTSYNRTNLFIKSNVKKMTEIHSSGISKIINSYFHKVKRN